MGMEQRSVRGLSGKSLQVYMFTFLIRLTSTLTMPGYLPIDRSGEWVYQLIDVACLALVVHLLYRVFDSYSKTYQREKDVMVLWPVVIPCIIFGMTIHGRLNNCKIFDKVWTVSMNLDTVAMIPQLVMLSRTGGDVDPALSHWVACQFLSRCCGLAFWYEALPDVHARGKKIGGYWIVGAHALQVLASLDFMYYYLKSLWSGRRMKIPALRSGLIEA